mmetsp:Transcript_8797/g.21650  ORF Transcript_8797/g.21650 Transcript_8797/m.21650 type:complete len:308 (+) Transcript_8797:4318-5241(+)
MQNGFDTTARPAPPPAMDSVPESLSKATMMTLIAFDSETWERGSDESTAATEPMLSSLGASNMALVNRFFASIGSSVRVRSEFCASDKPKAEASFPSPPSIHSGTSSSFTWTLKTTGPWNSKPLQGTCLISESLAHNAVPLVVLNMKKLFASSLSFSSSSPSLYGLMTNFCSLPHEEERLMPSFVKLSHEPPFLEDLNATCFPMRATSKEQFSFRSLEESTTRPSPSTLTYLPEFVKIVTCRPANFLNPSFPLSGLYSLRNFRNSLIGYSDAVPAMTFAIIAFAIARRSATEPVARAARNIVFTARI